MCNELNTSALYKFTGFRHGSQIWPQLSAAGPTNRPQPKIIITIVIIKLKLWLATGCEAKVAAEIAFHADSHPNLMIFPS